MNKNRPTPDAREQGSRLLLLRRWRPLRPPQKDLPRAPKLFALAHELKHQYVDQQLMKDGRIQCGDYNRNEFIEKTAEVFAAEFIYPKAEMRELAASMGIDARTCAKKKSSISSAPAQPASATRSS
jgi:hypothetical protein